jgi:uracil-DNA glycosylase
MSSTDALVRHVAQVRACRLCPMVQPPPVVADPVPGARLMLVGQAPGPRERDTSRLFAYTAGRRLFQWMADLGVDEETFRARVWMSAVIRCFPGRAPAGGDRVPAPLEIANCAPWLERELAILRPATVMAVGSLAMQKFLPPAPLRERVGRVFTVERDGRRFEVVPLPHPSGRSTWINAPENQRLLRRALSRLARSEGWRATFG